MRLATFNILHGRSPSDGHVDVARFAQGIRRIDADVLALQEVDRDQPRSGQADLTAIAADAMRADNHRFVATLHGEPGTWVAATGEGQPDTAAYGIALLSRYPVRTWEVTTLPALSRAVLMVHPGSRRPVLTHDEPRAAAAAVLETPTGPLTVVATHLSFIRGWNAVQLRALVKVCRALPRPLALLGDLNTGPRVARRLTGWEPAAAIATFPSGAPTRQLDHVLLDGHVRPAGDPVALDAGVSDHRALVVDVALG